MPVLHVVSATSGAGKTAIAVGLASGFAAAGLPVQLFRAGSGTQAALDAATFGTIEDVQTTGEPIGAQAITPPAGTIAVIEMDAGQAPATGVAVLVVRARPGDADKEFARVLGERLLGTIAMLVHPAAIEATARDLTNGGFRPLALIPEDAALAAPGVAEIRDALGAEVLNESGDDDSIEDVVIAPIYTDPARPHFGRFGRTAIFTPSYKTDLQLTAIESGTVCLVITGGRRPSPYVIDRVQHQPTNILLAPQVTTVAAIDALGGTWTHSRFRGVEKAKRIRSLLASRLDFAALARRLG